MQLSTMIGQWQLVYLCDQLLIYVQSQGYTPILDSNSDSIYYWSI